MHTDHHVEHRSTADVHFACFEPGPHNAAWALHVTIGLPLGIKFPALPLLFSGHVCVSRN